MTIVVGKQWVDYRLLAADVSLSSQSRMVICPKKTRKQKRLWVWYKGKLAGRKHPSEPVTAVISALEGTACGGS